MRLFITLLAVAGAVLVGSGAPALADEISTAPGWSLNKITEGGNGEDNTYSDARTYFSLKPPDARPAISIDARTADRLRGGEISAESAYAGQNPANGNNAKKEDDEFVYGNHGNGVVVADAPNSTLTEEEGRKEQAMAASGGGGSSISGLKTAGGLQGFNSGGGGASPIRSTAGAKNASGASSAPPGAAAGAAGAAGAAAAGGGGPAPAADPRSIALAQAAAANSPPPIATSTSTGTGAGVSPGGISVNNAAAGFGVSTATSTSNNTNFSVWPNGDPASQTGTNTSTAASGVTFNQSSRPVGLSGEFCNDNVTPVILALSSFDDCMSQINTKLSSADGTALMPDGLSVEGYCRRQFPLFNQGVASYKVNAKLYVSFAFPSFDGCTSDLGVALPAFGAAVSVPGREAQTQPVAVEAYCHDLFPTAPPAANPPPLVLDDSGGTVSGPAKCGATLDQADAFFCYDTSVKSASDPGRFGGYQNPSRSLAMKDCQSWCQSYGLTGACLFTQDKAPCGQTMCRFWPDSLCSSRQGFKFLPIRPVTSTDALPQANFGTLCQ